MKNKIKHYLIFAFIFTLTNLCLVKSIFGQPNKCFFENDSIKFGYGRVGTRWLGNNKVIPSKYIVLVKSRDSVLECFKKNNKREILKLLKDPKTDWATNLLLYCLYKRDAIEYNVVITDRKKWLLLNEKRNEIKYWTKHLK